MNALATASTTCAESNPTSVRNQVRSPGNVRSQHAWCPRYVGLAPLTLEWNLYLKGVRQEHGKAAMALRDGT